MTTESVLGHSLVVDRTSLALCVDLLGPLVLRLDGRAVDVPGARRRALLALLALEGERGMSTDRLIDALWPDDPPGNAVQALYNHVSRLRGHLGPYADRLERHATGYRLRLAPNELDADAARRLISVDPDAALALWRGPALVEFRGTPALEAESVGLDELRLQLVDDLLEARLARGDRTAVIDATAAAAASPLRERTALLHVRALAIDGRTAEAMTAAQAFRRRLVGETGLDPTPALADLEQLVAAGDVERPPDVTTRRIARPDSPMVGRQHDREEVMRLMRANSMVTITGPGGVGKTRLALDIAADPVHGADVLVVHLAAVDRPERVCQAAASTLGLRTTGDVLPADVAAALEDQKLLLVLDNCEHVVDVCRDLVTAVRRHAPQVQVLTTSRTTLHVPGEYVVRLQPLPVPRDGSDLDALPRHPGVRAFVEHARRRRPDYELVAEDANDLVEVLHRLDGLPLGIELAARQVAVMPMRAVRERLDRALDLATGPKAHADERHLTLRATIDSSYRLLDDAEQRLLRAIAPFPGGVDLGTVEALASPTGSGDPLDLLHRLVESSLVVADATDGRYRLLFTVRAFLLDELVGRGEIEDAHGRFVARCVSIAAEIDERMFGPDEATTDRRLRSELANLRAARDLDAADARVRITVAVNRVATWRDLREIWAWAAELAEDAALVDHPQRVAILAGAAEAARLVGDFEAAERHAREAIALAEADARSGAPHRARSVLGVVAHFRGDFATARDTWLLAAEGSTGDESAFVGSAALASAYDGDLATARTLLDRARSIASCGSHHAFVAYVEGELRASARAEDSIPFYLDAISQASHVGCTFVEGVARVSLASARSRIGDVAGAAEEYGYLLEAWRRTGQATQLWTTARNAAHLLASAGRTETAALLLMSADAHPGAAAVGPEIARFSGRSFTPMSDLVDGALLEDLRSQFRQLGSADVLDRAVAELRELADQGTLS